MDGVPYTDFTSMNAFPTQLDLIISVRANASSLSDPATTCDSVCIGCYDLKTSYNNSSDNHNS